MTYEEFEAFTKELFIAFPSMLTNINDNSKNPTETIRVWYRSLHDITIDEARDVLNEWITGKREPPKAYERDYVALVIRSRIGFKKSEYEKYKTAKSIYEHKRSIEEKRKAYQPLMADMVDMVEYASEQAARQRAGEITMQEYKQIVARKFYELEKCETKQ